MSSLLYSSLDIAAIISGMDLGCQAAVSYTHLVPLGRRGCEKSDRLGDLARALGFCKQLLA